MSFISFPDVPHHPMVDMDHMIPIEENLPDDEIEEVLEHQIVEARATGAGKRIIEDSIDDFGRHIHQITDPAIFGSKVTRSPMIKHGVKRRKVVLFLKRAAKRSFADLVQTATELLTRAGFLTLAVYVRRNSSWKPPRGSLYWYQDPAPIGLYAGETRGTKVGTLY